MPVQKILVVDDSRTELQQLSEVLTEAGFDVATAASGDEALAQLRASRPDLVLMDVVMPGANGFQLTRSITRDPAFASLPVFICTSKSQPTDRFWGMKQGATDYFVKPVATDALLARIRELQ